MTLIKILIVLCGAMAIYFLIDLYRLESNLYDDLDLLDQRSPTPREPVQTGQTCPECGGDGADHEDSSKDCWNCNGSGQV